MPENQAPETATTVAPVVTPDAAAQDPQEMILNALQRNGIVRTADVPAPLREGDKGWVNTVEPAAERERVPAATVNDPPADSTTTPVAETAPVTPHATWASLAKTPAEATPWDDNSKALLKSTFGVDDPVVLKQQLGTLQEQVTLQGESSKAANELSAQINSLNPIHREYIKVALSGKDPIAWAKSLPDVDLSKPVDQQSPQELVRKYYPDALNQDEWDTLNDKGVPAEDKAPLQRIFDQYARLSATSFSADQKLAMTSVEQSAQKQAADNRKFQESIAANQAFIKENHPEALHLMTNQSLQDFATGKLEEKLLRQDDGFSYKNSAYRDLLLLQDFANAKKQIAEAAREEGYNAGLLAATKRLPATAQPGGREREEQPDTRTEQERYTDFMLALATKPRS